MHRRYCANCTAVSFGKPDIERYALGGTMGGHLAPAGSNRETCVDLATFADDAERHLAALYRYIQENYGELAAHAAAECWLHLFEKSLEVAEDLPDLIDITADAVALFVATHQYICVNKLKIYPQSMHVA